MFSYSLLLIGKALFISGSAGQSSEREMGMEEGQTPGPFWYINHSVNANGFAVRQVVSQSRNTLPATVYAYLLIYFKRTKQLLSHCGVLMLAS